MTEAPAYKMNEHVKAHLPPFKCPQCGEADGSRTSFKAHLEIEEAQLAKTEMEAEYSGWEDGVLARVLPSVGS
ncbi:MAG: hypothetical protein M1814_000950 [Vezdaea aestivalis]|nr:MAG: hypothetical protein M1814_000950 [Vezdaea aestivalis]